MLKRTLTGIVFVIIILPVYFFSDTIILPVAVSALSVIGAYEMLKCIGTAKIWRISLPAYALAVVMPQLVRLFSTRHSFLATYLMIMFAYLMLLLIMGVFSHGQLDVEKIAASFMGVLYVVTAFICMIFMPLAYSISDGILLGHLSYVIINMLSGNRRNLTTGMYVLAVIFLIKFLV